MKHSHIVLLGLATFALAACERREERSTTTEPPARTEPAPAPAAPEPEKKTDLGEKKTDEDLGKGGGPATNAERIQARDRLATARCDHYKSCGDVAKGKKYDTFESCVTRERASLDKDWKLEDCPRVDAPRLDACINAVTTQKCGGIFNSSPSECGESKVCIK